MVDLVIAKYYGPLERTSLPTWDLTPPDPGLPNIKGTIESFYVGTESGSILSKVSAQQKAVQLWLHLTFSHDSHGQHELPLDVIHYHETGNIAGYYSVVLDSYDRGKDQVQLTLDTDATPGRYRLIAYDGDQKVAEAEYEVVP